MLDVLGSLPLTWIAHSGRGDGSGIRFYLVPLGLGWVHTLDGIEIVQRLHRYAVAWPSVHPDGRTIGWVDQGEAFEAVADAIPVDGRAARAAVDVDS